MRHPFSLSRVIRSLKSKLPLAGRAMGVKFWHIASYREISKSLIFFKIGGYIFITSLGVSLLPPAAAQRE